jgi:3-deoxy-D-arabino-heptulosonate 7-phosphate (DAHP) synthase
VEQASRAAIEIGSDGLMIEVANWGEGSGALRPLCDADQAITPATLGRIVRFVQGRKAAAEFESDTATLLGMAHES